MKLLTKELLARFAKIGRQEEIEDPLVVAKFFNPCGAGTWCTIWDDVGTYLTSSIDPLEKASLIVALAHFKKEERL
ncbi:MAG: DUF2958 domain-containing protein [Candidatus Levybacteria bacterium]|nr:DUF2958 domain-containing protein [Candidatus Levybacteria bacterium]